MAQRPESSGPIESQTKYNGEIPPLESTEFQFLTFTDISQTTDPKMKKMVRSHVMHRIQQNLRSERQKEKGREIVLDISSLSQVDTSRAQNSTNSMNPLIVPHPGDLGAGRSDPFARYPISMDVRTHELFDHLHGNTCPMFKTLSKIGFFKTILDEAAFRQVLCTSSSHMTRLRQEPENVEAIILSTEAIRSVNKRIADPVLGISNGVIITILAFACHSIMFNDLQGTLTHFNGLEEMIRRRGGLRSLSLDPVMRTVLFWIDVNAAFLHDRVPRFPIPDDILPRFGTNFITFPYQTLLEVCLTDVMVDAINDLLVLNQFIVSELTVRDLWDDGVFAGLYVVPLLNKLLSIRHQTVTSNLAVSRQESCRIAAILYLAGIRQRFGVNLAPAVYFSKLKDAIVRQEYSNLERTDPVLLWTLFIGAVQSFVHEDHRWFISKTAELIVRWQFTTWEELIHVVHRVLWIGTVLEVECEKFHRELSSESWNTYGHVFT